MQIHAQVSSRILEKSNHFFTGKIEGRIVEILQNARRAGATKIDIQEKEILVESLSKYTVSVEDNGSGIQDWSTLLNLGKSNWRNGTEEREDPAGIGLFSLAPGVTQVQSKGKIAVITPEGWVGEKPVQVEKDTSPNRMGKRGTRITFIEDSSWKDNWALFNISKFGGVSVTFNGEAIKEEPYLSPSEPLYHCKKLGVFIQVLSPNNDHYLTIMGSHRWYSNRCLNFYGHLVSFSGEKIDGRKDLVTLIEMTGEPTPLALLLPARTQLIANEALEDLEREIYLEELRYSAKCPTHTLYYKHYQFARDDLHLDIKESSPFIQIGKGIYDKFGADAPRSKSVPEPEDCLDFNEAILEVKVDGETEYTGEVGEKEQVSLFASNYKKIPGWVAPEFRGYSWSKFLKVRKLDIEISKILTQGDVNYDHTLCVIDKINAKVYVNDSEEPFHEEELRIFCSQDEDKIWITKEYLEEYCGDTILWFADGFSDDEPYETQNDSFYDQIQDIRDSLIGKWESFRKKVCQSVKDLLSSANLSGEDVTITVYDDSNVRISSPEKDLFLFPGGREEEFDKTERQAIWNCLFNLKKTH